MTRTCDLVQRLQVAPATYPNAKIFYMSGFTANSIIHNGQFDEGISFLQKPFRLKDLAHCLAETIAMR